jgi:hypothetical protein
VGIKRGRGSNGVNKEMNKRKYLEKKKFRLKPKNRKMKTWK